ncbi:MAG: hypothetical protein HKN21_13425 [Candidatus Eisenbacteria bacterium]|uniref:DNRLRE domain-containing protein n=1 Tax=Eiseniibacteriota bacterium TaxID=2212470 RepID=A0A7Y2E9L1_UNCEI|nr:hypothetical protein [Candidatus Eisenbacteria bacterium]
MMKQGITKLIALCIFTLATSTASVADVARLAPDASALCPDDGSGGSHVVFLFDLSELRTGEGRVIDEAFLDWVVPNLSSDEEILFAVYRMESSWNAVQVATGLELPLWDSDEVSGWSIEPLDFQRHGGLVRLNLRPLVEDWLDGTQANHGVFVEFSDSPSVELASELNAARLIIRYGFVQ